MADTMRGHRRPAVLIAVAVAVAVAVVVVIAVVGWWALNRGTPQRQSVALDTRTVQAGPVEIRMTPETLDASGAVFRLEFNTHSGALDLDPATAAHLRVNGQSVTGGNWSGPGPGGHHRAGDLRFANPVPPHAAVELRVAGLPQDAVGTWTSP